MRCSQVNVQPHAHLDSGVPCLVQDGADVLRHEVDAEHGDRLATRLRHLDRAVGHHQRIGDVDVRPDLGRPCQDTLDLHTAEVGISVVMDPSVLTSNDQHRFLAAACLWVHVEVRDDAHLGRLQLRRQLPDSALLRVQVQRLSLRKGALQSTPARSSA